MAEDNKDTTVSTKPKKKQVEQATESLIYVGPNLYTRGILTYQVYDAIPGEAMNFAETYEIALQALFVPISIFKEVGAELQVPGSFYSALYQSAIKAYAKEVVARNV